MIKSVTVINYLGEAIKMELGCPEKSGFLIQNIEGLGPTKADILMTEIGNGDGSQYNFAKAKARNIVLSLKLLPKPTVEDTRQLSYKHFPLKTRVQFIVETDNRVCQTFGYVESNEPVIFSSSETTQISIICPNPYFYSLDVQTTLFSGIDPEFEFQFSNESLIDPLIEFGNIKLLTLNTVCYTGDVEVGMVITIHAIGDATNITIANSETQEVIKIDTNRLTKLTGSAIIAGDDIIISTVKGNKYITLIRGGELINILNCLDRRVDWIQLSKGDNLIAYAADTGATNLQFKVENQILYEGV